MNAQQPTATVTSVRTATNKRDGDAPVDIVSLTWEGSDYTWAAAPGKYVVGQEVAIVPPAHPADDIQPAD